jgi:hypothetical protein
MTLDGAMSQLKADKSNLEEVARLYGLDSLTAEEKKRLSESTNLRKTFWNCFPRVLISDLQLADTQGKMYFSILTVRTVQLSPLKIRI